VCKVPTRDKKQYHVVRRWQRRKSYQLHICEFASINEAVLLKVR
jgi:hypothetical protein